MADLTNATANFISVLIAKITSEQAATIAAEIDVIGYVNENEMSYDVKSWTEGIETNHTTADFNEENYEATFTQLSDITITEDGYYVVHEKQMNCDITIDACADFMGVCTKKIEWMNIIIPEVKTLAVMGRFYDSGCGSSKTSCDFSSGMKAVANTEAVYIIQKDGEVFTVLYPEE